MFKANSDRLDYSEMLIPPVGYKTTFAVGTTYSLDLETLMSVSIALGLNEDVDSKLSDSPIYLLEALRKVTNKMLIFCEAGQIKVPVKQNKLFPFLENSVIMVNAKKDRAFHPKFWLVKYENTMREVIYRVLVLSRNLTFDRSWDVAICIEGKEGSKHVGKNEPVADFLKYLYARMDASNEKMADKRRSFKKLSEQILQVEFELNDKRFYDFEFKPLGISEDYDKSNTGLLNTYHEFFIISPFLSAGNGILEEIKDKQLSNADKTLITRKSELHKLTADFYRDFDTYTLKDDVIDGEDRLSDGDDIKKQDIHAKLYLRTKYSDSELYIGSANASNNAFNGNIELLLKLYAKRSRVNVSDLKQDLFGDDEKSNPFEKVQPIDYEDNNTDTVKEDLQAAIKAFCKAKVQAKITKGYTATVIIDKLQTEVDLYITPLLINEKEKVGSTVIFTNLALSQLSEFYILTARKGNEELSRVVKIRTDGIPEDRDSEIFNSVIGNKEGFIQYISFLLGDDYLLSFIEDGVKQGNDFKFLSSNGLDIPVLYEKMLKVASTSPDKLREIKRVMEMITDKSIIPESFNELYNTFVKAVLK